MRWKNTNWVSEWAVRWRVLLSWFATVVILAVAAGAGLHVACDGPVKPKDESIKRKVISSGRQAKRPPTARIQTDLALARRTKVQFHQPAELAYKDFNELVLKAKTFTNRNAEQTELPSGFQLLCYNDQPVGPTIRVRRGMTFHIHVQNALPVQQKAANHGINDNNEEPHELCITNLHTHGLHVSPTGNGDNVEGVAIPPGEDFTFEYTVPADHPSGTFWYHPHRHGSVAYQLSNGLAGALIVEGSRQDGIADLEDIPEIAAAKELIFVFQLYNYRVDPPGKGGVARVDTKSIYHIKPDKRACPAIDIPDTDPTESAQVTAINGIINPIIHLAPGEVQRWRLIHAAWDLHRKLYLLDKDEKPATDLQFYEIALDGLATGTMVAKGNDPNAGITVEIAPGQRSDVLIQAPLLNEDENERVYHLVQSDDQPKKPLAQIIVRGARRPMRLPDPRDLVKCQPFASIQDDELATTNKSDIATNGLRFIATPSNVPAPEPDRKYWINNKTYTHFPSPVQIRLNTAEQWTVKAVSDSHPFHVHVNPFQVVQHIDSAGKCTPMNVWRDTLFIKDKETYIIRSRFKDFLGKTVLHCHFLDHEDQGMMMPIELIPPYQIPKPAVVEEGADLKPTSTPVPTLKLADPKGSWHELTEFRSRNILLVFFRGMECSHCTEQLAKFVREARARMDPNTEILAISSRKIANPGASVKLLGVRADDRFTLLVDEEHRAFRAFGCYKEGPRHGLFLIDRTGVIRASYTGETPFNDVPAVAERANSLVKTGLGQVGKSSQSESPPSEPKKTGAPTPTKVSKAYVEDDAGKEQDRGRLNSRLVVVLDGVTWFDQSKDKTLERDAFILYLRNRAIPDAHPIQIDPHKNRMVFLLDRTTEKEESRKAWTAILAPVPITGSRPIPVSVGYQGEVPLPSDAVFELDIIPYDWIMWSFLLLFIVVTIIFIILAAYSSMLRDYGPEPPAENVSTTKWFWGTLKFTKSRKPFSLAWTQMAFWYYLILAAYALLWIITRDRDILPAHLLGLMGISASTALDSVMIDSSRPQGSRVPKESRGFITDMISDGEGVSFHRFQMFVWTLVLGIIFVASVINNLSMPTFEPTLLSLMGFSGATYLGFKLPELPKTSTTPTSG